MNLPENKKPPLQTSLKGAVERCGEAGRLLLAPTEDECESTKAEKGGAGGLGNLAQLETVESTQRLIELGHQRIVFLDSLYQFSEPGVAGTAFLDALSAGGITVGSYNMPGWEGEVEDLYAFLDSSFQYTQPTAIIAGSATTYFATLHFLFSKDIQMPRDLSLICVDNDPYFKHCRPSVSHIRWSSRSVANRIVNWVRNISQGKEDTRQTTIKAEFIEGGTIGVAPQSATES